MAAILSLVFPVYRNRRIKKARAPRKRDEGSASLIQPPIPAYPTIRAPVTAGDRLCLLGEAPSIGDAARWARGSGGIRETVGPPAFHLPPALWGTLRTRLSPSQPFQNPAPGKGQDIFSGNILSQRPIKVKYRPLFPKEEAGLVVKHQKEENISQF